MLPLPNKAMKIAVLGPSATKPRMGGYTCDGANPVHRWMESKPALLRVRRYFMWRAANWWIPTIAGLRRRWQPQRSRRSAHVHGQLSDKIIGQPETTEGERHDRCNLDLPGEQENFILEIAKVNPNVVVILQNGSAITMKRWLGSARAVLEAWYSVRSGNAIARVVFGDYNPAGRLPITFPATTGQCPLYYNPRPHGRVPDYCDHRGPLEQFAFGYGLSYTKFEYFRSSNIEIKARQATQGEAGLHGEECGKNGRR